MHSFAASSGYKLTQLGADLDDGPERPHREVDTAVDVPEVGKLYPQCLVHGCEVDQSICGDVVLVQGPPGLVKPNVLLWPPHGVIGPIHGNI